MARALTRAGVPCGHESVFHNGEVWWPGDLQADSSWMAATKLDQFGLPVLLLVRHPLAVVKSWVEIGFFADWDAQNPTHEPLSEAYPEVYDWGTPQDRALEAWVQLTSAALTRAEMILRFELVTRDVELFGRLLAWAGRNPRNAELALTEPPCNRHAESRERTGQTYEPHWGAHDPDLAGRASGLAHILGYSDEGS